MKINDRFKKHEKKENMNFGQFIHNSHFDVQQLIWKLDKEIRKKKRTKQTDLVSLSLYICIGNWHKNIPTYLTLNHGIYDIEYHVVNQSKLSLLKFICSYIIYILDCNLSVTLMNALHIKKKNLNSFSSSSSMKH